MLSRITPTVLRKALIFIFVKSFSVLLIGLVIYLAFKAGFRLIRSGHATIR